MKRENINKSGPTGIKVGRIFGPNSVWSCLGPLVSSPSIKVYSNTGCVSHGAVVYNYNKLEGTKGV